MTWTPPGALPPLPSLATVVAKASAPRPRVKSGEGEQRAHDQLVANKAALRLDGSSLVHIGDTIFKIPPEGRREVLVQSPDDERIWLLAREELSSLRRAKSREAREDADVETVIEGEVEATVPEWARKASQSGWGRASAPRGGGAGGPSAFASRPRGGGGGAASALDLKPTDARGTISEQGAQRGGSMGTRPKGSPLSDRGVSGVVRDTAASGAYSGSATQRAPSAPPPALAFTQGAKGTAPMAKLAPQPEAKMPKTISKSTEGMNLPTAVDKSSGQVPPWAQDWRPKESFGRAMRAMVDQTGRDLAYNARSMFDPHLMQRSAAKYVGTRPMEAFNDFMGNRDRIKAHAKRYAKNVGGAILNPLNVGSWDWLRGKGDFIQTKAALFNPTSWSKAGGNLDGVVDSLDWGAILTPSPMQAAQMAAAGAAGAGALGVRAVANNAVQNAMMRGLAQSTGHLNHALSANLNPLQRWLSNAQKPAGIFSELGVKSIAGGGAASDARRSAYSAKSFADSEALQNSSRWINGAVGRLLERRNSGGGLMSSFYNQEAARDLMLYYGGAGDKYLQRFNDKTWFWNRGANRRWADRTSNFFDDHNMALPTAPTEVTGPLGVQWKTQRNSDNALDRKAAAQDLLDQARYNMGQNLASGGRFAQWAHRNAGGMFSPARSSGRNVVEEAGAAVPPGAKTSEARERPGVVVVVRAPAYFDALCAGKNHVDPSGAHITLAYLGKGLTEAQQDAVVAKAAEVFAQVPGGQVTLGALGTFPEGDHGVPHYHHVELPEPFWQAREALRSKLREAGVAFQGQGDQAWTPHMTVSYLPVGTPYTGVDLTGRFWADNVAILGLDRGCVEIPLRAGPMTKISSSLLAGASRAMTYPLRASPAMTGAMALGGAGWGLRKHVGEPVEAMADAWKAGQPRVGGELFDVYRSGAHATGQFAPPPAPISARNAAPPWAPGYALTRQSVPTPGGAG